jgi:hypothetical protein
MHDGDMAMMSEPLLAEVPKPGRYRHFKGGEYELLSVARHTETDELLVVYYSVDAPERIWVRPLEMFVEPVGGGAQIPRFQPTASYETGVAKLVKLVASAASRLRTVAAGNRTSWVLPDRDKVGL